MSTTTPANTTCETAPAMPLRVGFMRGIAPQKWAKRYHTASGTQLQLLPLKQLFAETAAATSQPPEIDFLLERCAPGHIPAGAEPDSNGNRQRFAIRLYTEQLAVVVEREHPLAEYGEIPLDMLDEIKILDHPDHQATWPAAEPWLDPSWRPSGVLAALEIVATGAGGILLPLAAARHLAAKKQHTVLPLTGEDVPPASTVWASWEASRDGADTQLLAGILRGRTPRSSRGQANTEKSPAAHSAKTARPATSGAGRRSTKLKSAASTKNGRRNRAGTRAGKNRKHHGRNK